jgi:hypothetical protein
LGVGAGKKEIVELREVAARECHFMETRTRTVRLGFGEGKIKDAANAMLTDTKPIMKLKAVGTQAPGLIHLWIWMGRRPSGMHGVAPYVHAQQGEGSTIAKDAPSCVYALIRLASSTVLCLSDAVPVGDIIQWLVDCKDMR